jgi:hypothetical protein
MQGRRPPATPFSLTSSQASDGTHRSTRARQRRRGRRRVREKRDGLSYTSSGMQVPERTPLIRSVSRVSTEKLGKKTRRTVVRLEITWRRRESNHQLRFFRPSKVTRTCEEKCRLGMEIDSRPQTLSDHLDPPRPISADNQLTTRKTRGQFPGAGRETSGRRSTAAPGRGAAGQRYRPAPRHPPVGVSRHLCILSEVGFVRVRADGARRRWRRCAAAPDRDPICSRRQRHRARRRR